MWEDKRIEYNFFLFIEKYFYLTSRIQEVMDNAVDDKAAKILSLEATPVSYLTKSIPEDKPEEKNNSAKKCPSSKSSTASTSTEASSNFYSDAKKFVANLFWKH